MALENEFSDAVTGGLDVELPNEMPFQTWSPMPFGRAAVEAVKAANDDTDEPLDFLIPAA